MINRTTKDLLTAKEEIEKLKNEIEMIEDEATLLKKFTKLQTLELTYTQDKKKYQHVTSIFKSSRIILSLKSLQGTF